MNLAPIALFVYNRPVHTRRTVEALQKNNLAGESDLFIFSDAAKKPETVGSVREVREYIRTITGFKSITIVERERNFGLASSIEDGVERLCDEQGEVIVVEDDLLVAPEFVSFMNRALQRYRDERCVMQISGYMFPGAFKSSADALFLPLISCWGWGTWKRAWAYYDPRATGFARLQTNRALREAFNVGGAYDYYHMLEQQMQGKIDSWGIRWLLSVFLQQGMVLYPAHSLVQNIGVDGSGTHGAGVPCLQATLEPSNDSQFRHLRLPDHIEIDNSALAQVRATLRGANPGVLTRVVRRLIG